MTTTIRLEDYRNPALAIHVEQADEGRGVSLDLDLDPSEILSGGRRPPSGIERAIEVADTAEEVRIDTPREHWSPTDVALVALRDEVRRLSEVVDRLPPTLGRLLAPTEARELAAMLWHHADETDRRWSR